MPGPFVPQTRMRLKPYTSLFVIKGGGFFESPAAFAAALAANQLGALVLVGAVQKLTPIQERGANGLYRELNADSAQGTFGKPVETYPGLPSYRLGLSRVMLYDTNLLEAFGFLGADIIEQKVPLILQAVKPVPQRVDPTTGAPAGPLIVGNKPLEVEVQTYFGGWFDKNPIEFDVESPDLRIIQEVEIIVTGVISSKTTIP